MAEDREPKSTDESTPAADDQSGAPADEQLVDQTAVDDVMDDAVADSSTDEDPDNEDPEDDDRGDGVTPPALVGATATPARRARRASADDPAPGKDVQVKDKVGTAAAKTDSTAGTKGRATPKQRRAPERPRRTGPARFVSESVGELRKVVYPTGTQLRTYFVVVLVFVLFVITFVSLLDLGFGWVILRVFG